MKKLSALVRWLTFVAIGASMILIADRQGWLPGQSRKDVASRCRHESLLVACPFCNKELLEKSGKCSEHGFSEAICFRCNPSLAAAFKAEGDWCVGHGLPESQCLQCNPALPAARGPLSPSETETVAPPGVDKDLSRLYRSPDSACQKHLLRVQFPSAETAWNSGLKFVRVERREVSHSLLCNAQINYDGNRYAQLSSRARGVVAKVVKNLGEQVTTGDLLAWVESFSLGAAKSDYLQAQAVMNLWTRNYAREQVLLKKGVSTEREMLEAETRLTEARISLSRAAQQLKNLGLSKTEIDRIKNTQDASTLLAITAPFDGIIVERFAVVGELVETTNPLFSLADTSRMWAILDVYETDQEFVRPGQITKVTVNGNPDQAWHGKISWVSAYVDQRTRTLKARAELDNVEGKLKDGMFAEALVIIEGPGIYNLIPKSVVQWEGCCNVAFVKHSDVLFEPRKIRLGFEAGSWIVVEDGLLLGEEVVTTGSFLLKTELLKGSIGAGCCEIDPGKR